MPGKQTNVIRDRESCSSLRPDINRERENVHEHDHE